MSRLAFKMMLLVGLAAGLLLTPAAQASGPVVHAVLFYSPTCPHCHVIMTETLPPLVEKYGQQLQILQTDVTTPAGQAVYQAAVRQFAISSDRQGVPTLIVGASVLVGSGEIPEQFPSLIEKYLAQDGAAWPAIEGLPALIARNPTASLAQPPDLAARLARDPAGNSLAIAILAGMILVLGYVVFDFRRVGSRRHARRVTPPPAWLPWVTPALIVVGMLVAGYLAYVEVTQSAAVCGPVGDCNAVQQSAYARLLGVLPIGVLGLAGYAAIAVAWGASRLGVKRVAAWGALGVLGLTLFGTLFSIYLTFLEPFVIGAVCAWCLTSAVVMTALLCLAVGPGKQAWYLVMRGAYASV